MRILIAEDEPALRQQLQTRLAGLRYDTRATADGREALYWGTEYPFDAAVLDLGLPGLGGLEVIRRLRAQDRRLPILVLTARGRWQDKVEGLEAGADDYLAKPFQMEELVARLRALLRRQAGLTTQCLHCGPLALDLDTQTARVADRELALTQFEYRLLEHLARHRARVVSKQELTDLLYPDDRDPDSNVLEVLVGRLRRKLDPAGELQPIRTLRGRGYRLALGTDAR